jgi:hypothetical protein
MRQCQVELRVSQGRLYYPAPAQLDGGMALLRSALVLELIESVTSCDNHRSVATLAATSEVVELRHFTRIHHMPPWYDALLLLWLCLAVLY